MLGMRFLNHRRTTPRKDDVFDTLRGLMPELLAGVNLETPVAHLPMDSLDLIELLCILQSEFGVRLTSEEFEAVATLGELTELIRIKSNGTRE